MKVRELIACLIELDMEAEVLIPKTPETPWGEYADIDDLDIDKNEVYLLPR